MNGETEEQRLTRKFVEKFEAFRLACRQLEIAAGELADFMTKGKNG